MKSLFIGLLVIFALAGCQSTQDVDLILLKKNSVCGQKCSAQFRICDDEITMTPIHHHNSCVEAFKYCASSCDDLGVSVPQTAEGSSNITMEKAKAKCLDLGFKAGTESFGQCVLKVSK